MQMRAEAGKMGSNSERGGDLDFFPTPSRSISTRLHRRSLFVVPREEVEEAMVEEAYLLYLLSESVAQSISACPSPTPVCPRAGTSLGRGREAGRC